MSVLWEVTIFSLSTNMQGETVTDIFANGQMQTPINVKLSAIVKGTTQPYQLTESDLRSLKLIDYNTRQELTGNWTYSTVEKEEFAHLMPYRTAPDEPVPPVAPMADDSQTIVLWVSSTKAEARRIGAQITQLSEPQSIITTTGGGFDSSISIRAHQPITYTMDDVSFVREDTAEGHWRKTVRYGSTWQEHRYAWDQDNYYVTSTRYPFVKVDRSNVDINGTTKPYGSTGSYFQDAFAYMGLGNDRDVSIFFMPPMGNSSTSRRGVYAWNEYNTISSYASITVNQRPNALCLTRLLFGNGWVSWYSNWQQDAWFTIYDLYGNSGNFSVKTNASNTISISNRYSNRELLAESQAIEPAAKL